MFLVFVVVEKGIVCCKPLGPSKENYELLLRCIMPLKPSKFRKTQIFEDVRKVFSITPKN